MKILHITSQHAESTGSGCYLQNILRRSQQAGYRNFLIAAISGGRQPHLDMIDEKHCRFLDFGLPPLPFPLPGMSDVMPYRSSRFGTLSKSQLDIYEECWKDIISTAIFDYKPDIIHSHHLWIMSSIARKCSEKWKIPQIISCHATDLHQFRNHPQLQERADCRQAEGILALSEKQKQEIASLYGIAEEKIEVVGSGIDNSVFRICEEKRPMALPMQLLYAGKLSFAKGVQWLLDTVAMFGKEDLHLHIAGSGSGDEGIRCLQQAGYLQERGLVSVHGRLEQEDLASLMQSCHAFILPSFSEGVPLVLLEALACGCRIICTDLPGCLHIVGDIGGQGVASGLVEIAALTRMAAPTAQKDEDYALLQSRLQSALQKMIDRVQKENTTSKLEREVRQEILRRNGWEQVFARIDEVYQQLGR